MISMTYVCGADDCEARIETHAPTLATPAAPSIPTNTETGARVIGLANASGWDTTPPVRCPAHRAKPQDGPPDVGKLFAHNAAEAAQADAVRRSRMGKALGLEVTAWSADPLGWSALEQLAEKLRARGDKALQNRDTLAGALGITDPQAPFAGLVEIARARSNAFKEPLPLGGERVSIAQAIGLPDELAMRIGWVDLIQRVKRVAEQHAEAVAAGDALTRASMDHHGRLSRVLQVDEVKSWDHLLALAESRKAADQSRLGRLSRALNSALNWEAVARAAEAGVEPIRATVFSDADARRQVGNALGLTPGTVPDWNTLRTHLRSIAALGAPTEPVGAMLVRYRRALAEALGVGSAWEAYDLGALLDRVRNTKRVFEQRAATIDRLERDYRDQADRLTRSRHQVDYLEKRLREEGAAPKIARLAARVGELQAESGRNREALQAALGYKSRQSWTQMIETARTLALGRPGLPHNWPACSAMSPTTPVWAKVSGAVQCSYPAGHPGPWHNHMADTGQGLSHMSWSVDPDGVE